jgi:prepilin peptidase CpaA
VASNAFVIATLAAALGASAIIDLRTRRLPNALTVSVAAIGMLCATTGMSGLSVRAALVGFAVGLVMMLPGHLIGATGAGDVKLFAALGTLVGPAAIATAFLYTAIAGGALAVIVAVQRRRLAHTITGAARLAARAADAAEIEHPRANNRFAYAPAIAVGTLLAALGL